MRIRAERDDLADVLTRAGRGVGTRSPLPILQGLLCEVEGGTLRVTGTDTEVTVRTSADVEVLSEGRTVIPARLASEAVRKLPPGAVTVEAADGEVEITGSGPRFKLRELKVDDFPEITDPDLGAGADVDGSELLEAISQVGVAASTDEARPTLTGVLFEGEDDHLRVVATDSYRLAVRDLNGVAPSDTSLVPYRALRELSRTIGDGKWNMAFGSREARFRSDLGSVTVRLIEAAFPNYRQLLPEGYPYHLKVDKAALQEAVGRASLVAEDHIPVRMGLTAGGVELSVIRQEVGEETEHVPGEYNGEEMTVAFNTKYLTDGLAAAKGDEVVLETVDPLKPGLLRSAAGDDFRYLLMPVRL